MTIEAAGSYEGSTARTDPAAPNELTVPDSGGCQPDVHSSEIPPRRQAELVLVPAKPPRRPSRDKRATPTGLEPDDRLFAMLAEPVLFDGKLTCSARVIWAVLQRYTYKGHRRRPLPNMVKADLTIGQVAADARLGFSTVRDGLAQLAQRGHICSPDGSSGLAAGSWTLWTTLALTTPRRVQSERGRRVQSERGAAGSRVQSERGARSYTFLSLEREGETW